MHRLLLTFVAGAFIASSVLATDITANVGPQNMQNGTAISAGSEDTQVVREIARSRYHRHKHKKHHPRRHHHKKHHHRR